MLTAKKFYVLTKRTDKRGSMHARSDSAQAVTMSNCANTEALGWFSPRGLMQAETNCVRVLRNYLQKGANNQTCPTYHITGPFKHTAAHKIQIGNYTPFNSTAGRDSKLATF